jgi:hypothetical protein
MKEAEHDVCDTPHGVSPAAHGGAPSPDDPPHTLIDRAIWKKRREEIAAAVARGVSHLRPDYLRLLADRAVIPALRDVREDDREEQRHISRAA